MNEIYLYIKNDLMKLTIAIYWWFCFVFSCFVLQKIFRGLELPWVLQTQVANIVKINLKMVILKCCFCTLLCLFVCLSIYHLPWVLPTQEVNNVKINLKMAILKCCFCILLCLFVCLSIYHMFFRLVIERERERQTERERYKLFRPRHA